jgi:acyl-CoA thioester hydrolase
MRHQITLRPIYADTDAEGVVYYGTYLAWLEKGRTELFRAAGFTVADLKDQGILFAVRHAGLDYRYPARYDELLAVQSEITEVRGSRIAFQHAITWIKENTITNEQDTEANSILLQATIELVCLDADTFRPRRVPPRLVKVLAD